MFFEKIKLDKLKKIFFEFIKNKNNLASYIFNFLLYYQGIFKKQELRFYAFF